MQEVDMDFGKNVWNTLRNIKQTDFMGGFQINSCHYQTAV
jgi:hypothetical protein